MVGVRQGGGGIREEEEESAGCTVNGGGQFVRPSAGPFSSLSSALPFRSVSPFTVTRTGLSYLSELPRGDIFSLLAIARVGWLANECQKVTEMFVAFVSATRRRRSQSGGVSDRIAGRQPRASERANRGRLLVRRYR